MSGFVAATFVLALLLQLTALPYYTVPLPGGAEASPDFIFVVVAFVALELRQPWSTILVLAAGALMDFASIDPPFTHVAAYATALGLLTFFRARLAGGHFLTLAIGLAAAAAAARGSSAGWCWLVRAERIIPGVEAFLAGILCDVAAGALILPLLLPVWRGLERKEERWFARA